MATEETLGQRLRLAAIGLGAAAVAFAGASLLLSAGGRSPARAGEQPRFRDADFTFAVERDGQPYTVAVDFLIQDDGSGTFEADAAAAQTEMLARFPGAVVQPAGSVSGQFVLNGYLWTAHGVAWSYNGAGSPGGLGDAAGAVQAAAATWNSSGADFAFSGGGPGNGNTGACSGAGLDGNNTVGWAPQGGNTLAVTCTWYANTGSPRPATEFDMQIDPAWSWTTGDPKQVDLQSVMTHELGHALGLAHASDPNAVMYATYIVGSDKRALTADDIAGAVRLYGPAAAAPPPAPTAAPPPPAPTPRPSLALLPGANLLTWPGATTAPASALAGQAGTLRIVYGWDAAAGQWVRYAPELPAFVSNMGELRQGQAYWFIASGAAQIPLLP